MPNKLHMTEAECLEALALNDGTTAFDLLDAADPKFEREFRRIDRALVKFLASIREHFPDAEYYTASGGFHLMLGKSHAIDDRVSGQQELVALSGKAQIGDGDF